MENEMSHSCSRCGETFPYSSLLRFHLLRKPFTCECCQQSFCQLPDLKEHRNIHTKANLFRPWESQQYQRSEVNTSNSSLSQEANSKVYFQTSPDEEQSTCGTSKNALPSQNAFYLQNPTKPIQIEKKEMKTCHRCSRCGETFSASSLLRIKNAKKSLPSQSYLENHLQCHIREKPYECQICKKSFAQKTNLTKHMRIHTGERPYQCQTCYKSFAQKTNLRIHMRIHTEERPYQCQTCYKSFTQKSNLTTHMSIHTDERPYQCQTCYKSFTQKSNLTTHMSIHTDERPYQCQTCYKSFALKNNLTVHMRIHTGERPYQCHTCYKSFTQKIQLIKHTIHTHTEENPY